MFYWEESPERVEELLRSAYSTKHANRFQHGYTNVEDLIQDVNESCWLGAFEDSDDLIHGFIILEWISDRIANLHVCTFTNEFDWIKAWINFIEPEVAKHVDQLFAVIPKETPAMVILAKRIGFKFKKVGNYYKGLKDL